MSINRQALEQQLRQVRRGYPAAADSGSADNLEQLHAQLRTLQEQVEIMLGWRGDVLDQQVTVRDLINLGLLRDDGTRP